MLALLSGGIAGPIASDSGAPQRLTLYALGTPLDSSSAKQCQIEDLEETVNICESDFPQLRALDVNRRESILRFVVKRIVGFCDSLSWYLRVGLAMKGIEVINDVVVEDCFNRHCLGCA